MANPLDSEFARNMVEALQMAVFDAEIRTLEMEGPFGYPTMAYPDFLDPKTFYTLRGVRAGLAAIAPLRARATNPTEEELLALAETITDSHGITSFFTPDVFPVLKSLRMEALQFSLPIMPLRRTLATTGMIRGLRSGSCMNISMMCGGL